MVQGQLVKEGHKTGIPRVFAPLSPLVHVTSQVTSTTWLFNQDTLSRTEGNTISISYTEVLGTN